METLTDLEKLAVIKELRAPIEEYEHKYIDIIYDLYMNEIIPILTNETDPHIYNLIGNYYEFRNDYMNAIKYYEQGFELKDDDCIACLSRIYVTHEIMSDCDKFIKYCNYGIEHGNIYGSYIFCLYLLHGCCRKKNFNKYGSILLNQLKINDKTDKSLFETQVYNCYKGYINKIDIS